jgi:hypothetical protein
MEGFPGGPVVVRVTYIDMLGRARYYTFVRSEAGERADQSSTSGISNPTDLAEPMESNERGRNLDTAEE